jgi:cysteine-rich repeat protein
MTARRRRCLVLGIVAALTNWSAAAHGHGTGVPFAYWGNFPPDAARCQRIIGATAARCALEAWRVRTACFQKLLDGGSCAATSVPDLVQRGHLTALNVVDLQCTSPEAQAVGFLLKFEAQTDLDNFCRAMDVAMVSAVYGPVKLGDFVYTPDPTTQACVDVTARAAGRLLRRALRSRRYVMDTIVIGNLTPSQKLVLIDNSTRAIARERIHAELVVDDGCPEPTFSGVYHRSASALLETVAQRADCLASAVYVQTGVVCPAPVCGNGMQESGEECDDANTVDGDGCSGQCTAEKPAVGP